MAGAEVTTEQWLGSATEQPDTDMETSLAIPAGPPETTGYATEQPNPVPAGPCPACGNFQWEVQVSFKDGMWWAMPQELSQGILDQWAAGAQQVVFNWDWKDRRPGSWKPDGAETSLSRYIIDFDTMEQRNMDNNRMRKVKVVAILR